MRWWWQRAELAQKPPEPSNAAVMEQIEIFRRSLKRFEGDLDEAMTEHRALRARMARLLEKREKGAQEAPGTTIVTPEGVTPHQGTEDRWTGLARIKASQRRPA